MMINIVGSLHSRTKIIIMIQIHIILFPSLLKIFHYLFGVMCSVIRNHNFRVFFFCLLKFCHSPHSLCKYAWQQAKWIMRFHIQVLLSFQISFIFRSNVIGVQRLLINITDFICFHLNFWGWKGFMISFPSFNVSLFTVNNRIVAVLNKLSAEMNTMPTLRISLKHFENDGKKTVVFTKFKNCSSAHRGKKKRKQSFKLTHF